MTNTDIIRKFNRLTLFKQNEHGAILVSFIIIFPFIMALIFITFEISNFLQREAKLSDAIEQATLALTVENNGIPNVAQQTKNRELVLSYANAYLPAEKFSNPIINIDDNISHLGYNAAVTMTYPAKFLSRSSVTDSISNIYTTGNGVAIKNKTIETIEPTDVVFVADYSGSMLLSFSDDESIKNGERINALRSAFKTLDNIIKSNSNVHTIGFIPFAWGTKRIVLENREKKEYCHFPFSPKTYKPNGDYIAKHRIKNDLTLDVIDTIGDIIDYENTIMSITENAKTIDIPMRDIKSKYICLSNSNAYSLEREQFDYSIENIIGMAPVGATLISSGILSANNIFKETANNGHKKLMIILSDGMDTYDAEELPNKGFLISKTLIDKGMCETIIKNGIQMVFIAIAYSPEKNVNAPEYINWKQCVGEDNYYEAHNAHELERDLQQAVSVSGTNEVGRNTPKK
ncbi:TadE/TadG family type IV pilus assembly protein [Yersinia kristensenii]|uniref:TadE/TadG family type IV pilus assembly protein n=1 Tax=Yersinia kristensenii TaxID=28152 RepID=UPI00389685D3